MPSNDDPVDSTDYEAVTIPDDEPKENYHWTERRADILRIIEQRGHPAAVSQTELAQQYGVTQSQISHDMDRLSEHIRDRLRDRSHRAVVVDTVVQKCVQELIEEEQYRAAAKTALEWEEFASSFADLEELHDRVAALETDTPTAAIR
jgi:DNA-binding MarR family transcriptional regulator